MTLNLGPVTKADHLGIRSELLIDAYGWADGVFAVRVANHLRYDNKTPHITVFCNTNGGYSPKDANNITDWYPIAHYQIYLTGIIQQKH